MPPVIGLTDAGSCDHPQSLWLQLSGRRLPTSREPTTSSRRVKSGLYRTASRGRRLPAPGEVGGDDLRRQLESAVHAEPLVQAFHVGLHRPPRQPECPGDFIVALVRQDGFGDLRLARRESELANNTRPRFCTKKARSVAARGLSWTPCFETLAPPVRPPRVFAWLRHPGPPPPSSRTATTEAFAPHYMNCDLRQKAGRNSLNGGGEGNTRGKQGPKRSGCGRSRPLAVAGGRWTATGARLARPLAACANPPERPQRPARSPIRVPEVRQPSPTGFTATMRTGPQPIGHREAALRARSQIT